MYNEIFQWITAGLALAISAYALVVHVRTLKIRQAQERDRVRAQIIVRLTFRPAVNSAGNMMTGTNDWEISVENCGTGKAWNIAVTLDDKPLPQHPALWAGQKQTTRLAGGASCRYQLFRPGSGKSLPTSATISWDDETGGQVEPMHFALSPEAL